MHLRLPVPDPNGAVSYPLARVKARWVFAEEHAARGGLRTLLVLVLLALLGLSVGCNKGVYYFGDDDLSYYKNAATEIADPDVDFQSSQAVTNSLPPRTVLSPGTAAYWDLPLHEAVQLMLENSQVMADLGGRVLANPTNVPTIYDPAVTQSDPRFGVEGALSAFDAQFTTSLLWSRNDRPLNNALIVGGIPSGSLFILQQDAAVFQSQIAKTTATGAQLRVTHNINYDFRNVNSNVFPSVYDGNVELAFTQPLLQGAGAEFNRIAGPNATPGFFFSSGVLIARINSDISIADFQAALRNLVSEVENAYWDLYFSYRDFAAQSAARDSALRTWRTVNAKFVVGGVGGAKSDEAQARQQLFIFKSRQVEAWNSVLQRERQLRLLMGISPTDARLIRPADEPTTALLVSDYYVLLAEALTQRVELRRQKWVIKRRELELKAAKNFLLPRLNLTGLYRVNGLGDRLLDNDTSPAFSNFYGELLDGQFTDWQIGAQLAIPLGFRQAHTAVRNAQLNLVRERRVLAKQEEQVAHDLSQSLQDIDRFYQTTQDNFNRRRAAEDEVESFQAEYDVGRVTLDRLIDAQQCLAEAERDYYNSLIGYNKALKQLHLAKGTLLEYNNIMLAEGPWPAGAYNDAARHAHERMRAIPLPFGITEPEPFALPNTGATTDPESLPLDEEEIETVGDELQHSPGDPIEETEPAEAESGKGNLLDLQAVEQSDRLPAFLESSP